MVGGSSDMCAGACAGAWWAGGGSGSALQAPHACTSVTWPAHDHRWLLTIIVGYFLLGLLMSIAGSCAIAHSCIGFCVLAGGELHGAVTASWGQRSVKVARMAVMGSSSVCDGLHAGSAHA